MHILFLLAGKIFTPKEIQLTRNVVAKTLLTDDYQKAVHETLLSALITGEDRRFMRHNGYDFTAIARAIINNLRNSRIEGASTIEQQLTRTITGNYEISLKRKIKEIIIASSLKRKFSKKEIAYCYITIAYYGWQMNNLSQAYKRLQFNSDKITTRQASEIIARLRYPEPRNPSIARIKKISGRADFIEKNTPTAN
ncbi:MAG: biosynthetic peptidoglycan transglycosylase [Pseudomonas sp.]|uniref:biosynthetic peptidoglycan transglycosylase n=1 Tax=Pseudomonas sp. TaxID=306 RepID=UPI003981E208